MGLALNCPFSNTAPMTSAGDEDFFHGISKGKGVYGLFLTLPVPMNTVFLTESPESLNIVVVILRHFSDN